MNTIVNGIPVSPIESAAFDLIEQGYAAVFGQPGEKIPYDPRPYQAVKDAGLRSGIYACWTTPEEVHAVVQAAEAQGISLTVGVRTGIGNLAVIDVDTTAAVDSLNNMAIEAGESPLPLTTCSPGKQDSQGTWIHRGGGHVWLRMPADLDVTTLPGTVTLTENGSGADAVDLKLDKSWVLCPPSTRAEGAYTWGGEPYAVQDCPQWILDRLRAIQEQKIVRTLQRTAQAVQRPQGSDLDEKIREWAEEHHMDDPLRETGWHESGKTDSCGCPMWTRPGADYGDKSATLHYSGCSQNDADQALLHIWTTDLGNVISQFAWDHDIKRMNTLQVYAAVYHDGDVGSLMRTEGLITRRGTEAFKMFLDEDEDNSGEPVVASVPTKATFGNLMDFMPAMSAPKPARPDPVAVPVQPTPVQPVPDETLSPTPAVPRIPVTPTATDDEFWNIVIFTGDAEEVWDAAGHFDDPRLATLGMWTAGMILTDPETHQWSVTAGQIMEACPMIDPREVTALAEHGGVTDRPVEFLDWLLAVA